MIGTASPVRPALVYGLTFTGMMVTILITPVIPDILDDFGVARSHAGVLVTASTVPAILAAPVMGVLADRFGRAAVLVPCICAVAVLGVAGAFAPSYAVLLVLRVLQGTAAAGLVNLAVVLVADRWEGAERSRILGRNAAVLTGSTVVLAPLGGWVASLGTWRLTFLLYAGALIVALPIVRADTEPAAANRHDGGGSFLRELTSVAAPLRDGTLRQTIGLGVVVVGLVFGWSVTLAPLHAGDVLGVGPDGRGLLVGVGGFTATMFALSSTVVIRSLGHRAAAAGLACFSAGYLLVAVRPTSLIALVVGLALAGSAQGVLVPLLQGDMAAAAPSAQRGAVMSLWGSAVRTGQTVGPLSMGALLGAGTGPVYAVGAGIAALAALGTMRSARRSSARHDRRRNRARR